MHNVIFTDIPFYDSNCLNVWNHNKKLATPDWFNRIEHSDLMKSLTKYGDLYVNDNSSYLDGIGNNKTFKKSYALHLAFREPFDEYESMSIIQIWGNGQTHALAQENLVKHINNLWEYEDLLLHYYCNDVTPFNKYCYFIYDPQDIKRHNLTSYADNKSLDKWRASINYCGHIYTNVAPNKLSR